MEEPKQAAPAKTPWIKKETLAYLGVIALIEVFLILLKADNNAFLAFNILMFALILGGPVMLWVWLHYFAKSPERMGAAELWQECKRQIVENRMEFGYPDSYDPQDKTIIRGLGLFLVHVHPSDIVMNPPDPRKCFIGTIVFDIETMKIWGTRPNQGVVHVMEELMKYRDFFDKNRKTELLPIVQRISEVSGFAPAER